MPSPVKYFFWACSGATISLLKKKECETEHNKYVGIGAAVFLTGVLAVISASYAFSTVLESRRWAIALGVFWGMMIFNLDRYLVLSIRNTELSTNPTLQERLRDWGRILLVALPRVALAALLAAAITRPLELLIFKSEIEFELSSLQADQATESSAGEASTIAARIQRLKDENTQLEKDIADKQAEQEKARQAAVDEAEGRAKLPAGEGRVFDMKTKIASDKETDTKQFVEPRRDLIVLNNGTIKALTARQLQVQQNAEQQSRNTDGLATRLQAFSRLTSKNPVIRLADLIFMAIILILETAPILTKVYARYGPYDKLVDIAEAKVYLAQKLELENFQEKLQTDRESYQRRKDVLHRIQDLVIDDTLTVTATPKTGSQSYQDLEYAKLELIQQATAALTHASENGSSDD